MQTPDRVKEIPRRRQRGRLIQVGAIAVAAGILLLSHRAHHAMEQQAMATLHSSNRRVATLAAQMLHQASAHADAARHWCDTDDERPGSRMRLEAPDGRLLCGPPVVELLQRDDGAAPPAGGLAALKGAWSGMARVDGAPQLIATDVGPRGHRVAVLVPLAAVQPALAAALRPCVAAIVVLWGLLVPVSVGLVLISVRRSSRGMAERSARIQAIHDAAVNGILTVDVSGRIETLNRAAERLFGYTPEELIGENVRVLMPEPDCGRHDGYLRNYLQTGERKIIGIGREVMALRRDGTQFPADLSVSEVKLDGVHFFTGIVRDITSRKEAEAELQALNAELEQRVSDRTAELLAANRGLEAFSSSVSHDLRAPLRSIDGFSQILEEDCGAALGDEGRGYLARVRANARHMDELLSALLELSRVTRGELDQQPIDVTRLALAIGDDLRLAHPDHAVELVVPPALVGRGDRRLLRVVLENLLGNAWKFTRNAHAARVEVGLDVSGDRPEFFVTDNGAGFDMIHAERLFRPFHRLHTNEQFEGTGIGLATVYWIVQRHGGQVRAEGTPGGGSTFYFTLGRQTGDAAAS